MQMVKPKPDISLAKKTGHFDLLTTQLNFEAGITLSTLISIKKAKPRSCCVIARSQLMWRKSKSRQNPQQVKLVREQPLQRATGPTTILRRRLSRQANRPHPTKP
jgi:hypothetical protein